MAMRFWTCSVCKRRVPETVDVCRCGALKASASATGPDTRDEAMPWDVQALLAAMFLVLAFAAVQLFRPHPPSRLPAVLGYLDPPRPAVTTLPPRPTATLANAPKR